MATIEQDAKGLYAWVGGYAARPSKPTKFKAGDKVTGKHFGGSTRVGMGKLPGRGEYEEIWATNVPVEEWDITVGSVVEIAYPRRKGTITDIQKTSQHYMGFRYNLMTIQFKDGTEIMENIYRIHVIHSK
jgi:hypothetical protein